MTESFPYQTLANLVLAIHIGLVAFVVLGLVIIIGGNLRGWRWVNNLWFRLAHLATIAIVVAEAWLGIVCPLTTLEMWLREQGGEITYAGSFIQYWLQSVLYFDLPAWVFILVYSLFGALVLACCWLFPPRFKGDRL
ncbi:DUF2784 domain-containing protein [Halopseudomonas salina]|uniref:DUF2784 domain-containing protein n=1 Tax=Halopseudomonas salina TaxID=1323744 RepID=A0ABQ1Q053_9GAMM|nr:DUF2784 domain-containing protein [Halopseudomonas salina]GGD07997.1 hypothetical protein GCM10007418_28800 [Halopseudomonas salina]